jgi:hypothetical protein
MLLRSDGRALFYPGKVHALQGEPESGKTWVALHLAAERLGRGETVLYIDFEDTAASVVGRLQALGVDPDAIRARFRYLRPEEPLSEQGKRDLDAAADGASLAVIDGITEAMTLHGWDLRDNTDIAKWLALLPRRLARNGTAVAEIDHVVKDKDGRGRWALGGQHKLAGVDCAYGVHVIAPLGRGREGRLKITVEKDRAGHVRGFATEGRVADVTLPVRRRRRHGHHGQRPRRRAGRHVPPDVPRGARLTGDREAAWPDQDRHPLHREGASQRRQGSGPRAARRGGVRRGAPR